MTCSPAPWQCSTYTGQQYGCEGAIIKVGALMCATTKAGEESVSANQWLHIGGPLDPLTGPAAADHRGSVEQGPGIGPKQGGLHNLGLGAQMEQAQRRCW